MFAKLLTVLGCVLFFGCNTTQSSPVGAFFSFKKEKFKYLSPLEGGAYKTPCIHLPFIDKNFPEYLNSIIRLHDPKVDLIGAYKISRLLVEQEGKVKTHVIDTGSVKLCRLGNEMGYSFKAVNIEKNK